jgi:hypothetical protein
MSVSALERSSLLTDPKVEPQDRLDAELLPMLAEAMPESTISTMLAPSPEVRATEWQKFDDNPSYLPNFRVREEAIDTASLEATDAALSNLRRQLKADKTNDPATVQMYKWRVNELLGQVRMVRASQAGNMELYTRYNRFIYGEADPQVFSHVVDHYMNMVAKASSSNNEDVRNAAKDVERIFGGMPRGDEKYLAPSDETFQTVRDIHFRERTGYIALALAGVKLPEGKVTQEMGDPILHTVLGNVGAAGYGIEDAEGLTWSASNKHGKLVRPAKYNMGLERLLGLAIGHELRHILEYQNGLRGPVGLAAIGFDRYERGNEPAGVIGEQLAYPDFASFAKTPRWDMLIRRQLMTSLAQGHSGKSMNLRQVHDAMYVVAYLERMLERPDTAHDEALKRTRTMIEAVYKGSDGSPGAVYGGYSLYLDGTVDYWGRLAEHPEHYGQTERGKFDLVNPRHEKYAKEKRIASI